ncbi:MAG: flagellar protein export ATPase FliI [Thiobacillaceae bacterium]
MNSVASPSISQYVQNYLSDCGQLATIADPIQVTGKVTRVTGLVLESAGLKLAVGSGCNVLLNDGSQVEAEVVGFANDRLFLMPHGHIAGVAPGARVIPENIVSSLPKPGTVNHPRQRASDRAKHYPVGTELLGRVVDGMGRPLDDLGDLNTRDSKPLYSRPSNPLARAPINEVLDVGIRAINALLTIGRGQRIGLFAGSGVGKSVLLGMMARYTSADVIVVGLIGERGREVKEFIEHILGPVGLARSVVVAAPADTSPLMRLQGAAYATTIAEHFRDEGKNVLLIMDSLTRYAMAQREIALAVGEPPASKGYPPSVFAKLPQLVERAGNGKPGGGSITAFYTVLSEGDDQQDPIADSARAILDGHIVLSRSLADSGHYPAIDVEASISRAMTSLVTPQHLGAVRRFKQLYSRYQRSRDLITVGAYAAGSDAVLDQAIAAYPSLESFLQQEIGERAVATDSLAELDELFQ